MSIRDNVGCLFILFLLWIVINVADGFWLYFYVNAKVNPNPRTAVNRTSSAYNGYTAMMFIFGMPWGIVNGLASLALLAAIISRTHNSGGCTTLLLWTFGLLIVLPSGIFITVMPFFGGWIVTPIAQKFAWNHLCDGYPMYAILDGKSYNAAEYVKNVVYFYETNTNRWLYTYEISNPNDDDQWLLHLRDWSVNQDIIPLEEYPTLQSVGYNFVDDTLSGNCTLPASPSNFVGNTTTSSCMSGTFDPGNHLFFNITSTVPLNNTANPSSIKPVTTILKIEDSAWTYGNEAPALILHQVDSSTGLLNAIVLRTAATKLSDCTELKVCLQGVQGREGGQVGAEVLAPLGVMLMQQAQYAIECTTPSDDDDD